MAGKLPTSSKRLAIGVAGLGTIGRQHAINALHYAPRMQLIAACSPMDADIEWAEKYLVPFGVKIYRKFEDMVEQQGLEALLVASPTKFHAEQVIAGINRGLHVLCEKPIAFNAAETRQILEMARRKENAHLKVMVAFSRRYDLSYQNAAKAIQSGRIGTPIVLRQENRDKTDISEAFNRYLKYNSGIFIESGVHGIDLDFLFLGADAKPKSAFAMGNITHHKFLRNIDAGYDVDTGVGIVQYYPLTPGGPEPIAYHNNSRVSRVGFDNQTEIIGTEATLKINMHPRRDLMSVADENGIGNDVMPDFYERYKDAFVKELDEFADSALDDTPMPYELETAMKGMEIAEALQESIRTGKKIEWDVDGKRTASL